MADQITASNNPASSWADFAKWGGAFAVYGVVILAMSDSEEYGELGTTMAWIVALGAFMYWYNAFDSSLATMISEGPSTTGPRSGQ